MPITNYYLPITKHAMPTFAQHETAQRLHQTGVGSVYALKSDEKRVLKLLQSPAGIWTEQQLRDEVDAFLLRLKTQRDIAKISKAWAPVHEVKALRAANPDNPQSGGKPLSRSGNTVGPVPASIRPTGAYAILDRYERSLHSLIDGRVRVTNNDLRNILGTVVRGLNDLRKTTKRPHGNLKPSNILLANSADLATATVHLSDPAPDGALNANSGKKELADLAKILFELVNLRPYVGGTIGPSKEWNALGPNGEDWRKLCNALLDPGAPADERDLEKIAPQIDTWIKQPKKSKAPLIAAAVLGVLILGGVGAWIFTRPPKIDFDQPRWEKLCLSYHAWFGDFLDNMTDDEKKKLAADPYPAQIVKLLNDAGRDLPKYEPKAIAKQGQTPKFLAANPTDAARTGYGPYYTKQGDELIDRIRDAMTPAQWPLLGTLDITAAAYEKRGWFKPAAGIRALIASARPPPSPPHRSTSTNAPKPSPPWTPLPTLSAPSTPPKPSPTSIAAGPASRRRFICSRKRMCRCSTRSPPSPRIFPVPAPPPPPARSQTIPPPRARCRMCNRSPPHSPPSKKW